MLRIQYVKISTKHGVTSIFQKGFSRFKKYLKQINWKHIKRNKKLTKSNLKGVFQNIYLKIL